MTDQAPENKTTAETKSQAQQDYENGQEFLKNGDMAQAANAFHNALIGFEQEQNENGVANASDKLGDICTGIGEHAKALSHYERAYAVCTKHADRFSMFSLEKKKAGLMLAADDLDQAITLYLEVLDEYSALRNPKGSVETLEKLAEIYLKKGARDKAADSYRMAASIHRSFRHKREAAELEQKAEEIEKRA